MSTSLPPTGPFNQMMNGYFGSYTSDVKDVIWKSFLERQGLSSNPSDGDTARLQAFSEYVNTYYDNLLFPDIRDGEKDRIVWTIFDILLAMMQTMTNTQISSQKLKQFFINKQAEYRRLMSRTVLYVGGEPTPNVNESKDGINTKTTPNVNNLSLFNLGYCNITVEEVLKTLVEQADRNFASGKNDQVQFEFGRPTVNEAEYGNLGGILGLSKNKEGYFSLSVQKLAEGTYRLSVRYRDQEVKYSSGIGKVFGLGSYLEYRTRKEITETVSGLTSDTAYTTIAGYFKNVYNTYKGIEYDKEWGALSIMIPWPKGILFNYTGDNSGQKNEFFKSAGTRAEMNKRSQSFIDVTKSRIDIQKDFSEQQDNVTDAASNGVQQTSNILQGTMRQLQNILNSIFKR